MTHRAAWHHPGHPVQLLLGLTIWCLWFVALYGALSILCAVAPPALEQGALSGLKLWLGLFTLVTLGGLLWLARCCLAAVPREPSRVGRFIAGVAAGLYLFAASGVAFVALPLVALPPCL